jgi:hypothetical protein
MAHDDALILIFASMHLVALLCGGLLFAMFARSSPKNSPGPDDDEGGGGGGNDRVGDRPPASSPSGGLPLPDAEPAPVRLRSGERLRDLRPRRERRPLTHPDRRPTPHRVPAP